MKFKHQVLPGDTLVMEIVITRTSRMGGYADVKPRSTDRQPQRGEIMTVLPLRSRTGG